MYLTHAPLNGIISHDLSKFSTMLSFLSKWTDTISWLTGMRLWRSEYGPFIRFAQWRFGRRLIVVPMTTFHRLAETIGDPVGELVFLFNTGRCGSTLLTQVHRCSSVIMPPPRGHYAVIGVRRPSVCLSVRLSNVAYIGSNSKTKRPRKTKLCTGVPQVTCDCHTDFKVKRSNVKVTGRRHIVASIKRAATWRTAADITSLKYYLILQCL